MKLKQIAHIAFTCKDLEASVAFYRDVLGCTNKFRIRYGEWLDHLIAEAKKAGKAPDPAQVARLTPIADKTWIAYMEMADGQFIELFDAGAATEFDVPDGTKLNYNHLSIETDDIHALYDRLTECGVKTDSEPKLGLEHTWQLWTQDPDGNRIEFMMYTTRSWQLTGHEN